MEKYEAPEIKIEEFEVEDIITGSNEMDSGDLV